jgi:hypothetical protein
MPVSNRRNERRRMMLEGGLKNIISQKGDREIEREKSKNLITTN